MIDPRRFTIALIVGLVPLMILAAIPAFSPTSGFSLAGDTNSPGFRMYVENLDVEGMSLSGTDRQGENVAHLDIGNLSGSSNVIIERDFSASSLIPGAPVHTIQVKAPQTSINALDLYTRRACLRGVNVDSFFGGGGGVGGFFGGLFGAIFGGIAGGAFEGPINDALRDGYDGSFSTGLVNLIGPGGSFSVDRFYAETVELNGGRYLANQGIEIRVVPQTTSSVFVGSCL